MDIDRLSKQAKIWQMVKYEVMHLSLRNPKIADTQSIEGARCWNHKSQSVSRLAQHVVRKAKGILAFIPKELELRERGKWDNGEVTPGAQSS